MDLPTFTKEPLNGKPHYLRSRNTPEYIIFLSDSYIMG